MKLYISADIEGVAGVTSRDQLLPGKFEYEQARKWMTGEVRAACEGAVEAGVEEVLISDSHGNGQNLLIDELPDNCRVVRSWPRPLGMAEGIQEGGFAAAMLIGYHAGSTSVRGTLAHTMSTAAIRSIRINGELASEGLVSAATAGEFGVPAVLISGDDAFVAESEEYLGNALSVVTKRSLGTLSVASLTPNKSRVLIRAAAKRAMESVGTFKAIALSAPMIMDVSFKHRMPAEVLDYLPIVTRTDAFTVSYEAKSMSEAVKFLSFVLFYEPTLM